MKKSINFIILGVILFVITIISYIFTQNKVEIPKETIISAVTSQFPIEKSMYTLGDMKLSNPTVYFENDKLIIDADYKFKDRATSELTTGKAKFESELEYKNSNLYLWKINNKRWKRYQARQIRSYSYKYHILRTTIQKAFALLRK